MGEKRMGIKAEVFVRNSANWFKPHRFDLVLADENRTSPRAPFAAPILRSTYRRALWRRRGQQRPVVAVSLRSAAHSARNICNHNPKVSFLHKNALKTNSNVTETARNFKSAKETDASQHLPTRRNQRTFFAWEISSVGTRVKRHHQSLIRRTET